jgi:hypothetical protein
MRRIKLVLAAIAIMVMAFVAMSGTAVAHDWDDWNGNWNGSWNNCSWNCNGWNNNWNTNWNNNWWWWNNPWRWNNNFNNCLFLPAVTIC